MEKSALKENYDKTLKFFRDNKWILTTLLLVIVILLSTYFRMYPHDLPIADEWAENNVNNFFMNNFMEQINQQYPHLPQENKNRLAQEKMQEFLEDNPGIFEQQVEQNAKYLKSRFQYDHGDKSYTYLLAIDPYLWYGYGKNELECGESGCISGEDGYSYYRRGRVGELIDTPYISIFGVWIYKVMNIFTDIPLMQAFFLIPIIMIGLAIIPAFFIAKRFAGNMGGFFAGILVALNTALLSRTPGGFSDTDAANITFPLFILWFFVKAIYSKDIKSASIYSILGGLTFFLYSRFWSAFQVFDILGAGIVLGTIIAIILYIYTKRHTNIKEIYNQLKEPVLYSIIFMVASLIILVLSNGFSFIVKLFTAVIGFIMIKDVGITTLWPNVMTTVAEFNTAPLSALISQMGGAAFWLFAIIGLISLFWINNRRIQTKRILFASVLIIYIIATIYSFTKGIRFAILMIPAFSVAFGIGVGAVYNFLRKNLSKSLDINQTLVTGILIIASLMLILVPVNDSLLTRAHNTAKYEIPSYNDAWDSLLEDIKADASDGIGYITTWWDFGHWFAAKGVRVTFDGGDQGERIHWVGKAFLTEDEKLSAGIMRMLNCGQENTPHILEEYLDNDTVKAISIIDQIVVENKSQAKQILLENGLDEMQADEVLVTTHCEDLLPHYAIASEDMVGKSGVWGHFGDWNFTKALMYNKVRKMKLSEGVDYLTTNFNLTQAQAQTYFTQIKSTNGDNWISEWPNYYGSPVPCEIKNETATCIVQLNQQIPVNIDLNTMNATVQTSDGLKHPQVFVYPNETDVVKVEYEDNLGFGLIFIPQENGVMVLASHPKQTNSIFTRMFFYEGHGLKYYDLFDNRRQINGQDIFTYKLDYSGQSKYSVYADQTQSSDLQEEEVNSNDGSINRSETVGNNSSTQ